MIHVIYIFSYSPVIFAPEYEKYVELVKRLENENRELRKEVSELNQAMVSLKNFLTDGQIKKLKSFTKIMWKWEDISNAIFLHAAGPRAYKHLYQKDYPVPSISTLHKWYNKIDTKEGILWTSIELMRQVNYMTTEEKICLLSFDEMKVTETFEYDLHNDFVRKPANYVQVVMASGIIKSWKQPVFYDFEFKMSKEVIFKIISVLKDNGYTVVAVVCDMGPSNRKLWRDLGITPGKYSVPDVSKIPYHTCCEIWSRNFLLERISL